jgi:hypothetical protein
MDPRRHPEVGVLMLSQHVESAGAVGLVTEGWIRLSSWKQSSRCALAVPGSGRAIVASKEATDEALAAKRSPAGPMR